MLDFAHICFFIFIIWGLGQGLLHVLKQQKFRLLAGPLGLGAAGLIVNFLYFGLNLPLPLIRPALIILGLLGLGLSAKQGRPGWKELGWLYLLLGFLALPAIIGGQQYYVFRGVVGDQFNYIEMALAAYEHPPSFYKNLLLSQIIDHPILLNGHYWFHGRPAAALLFGLTLSPGQGDIHLKAFLYQTALWAMLYPAIKLFWLTLTRPAGHGAVVRGRAGQLLFGLVPLGFTLGFYGQLIFDMNAWSHLAALPILLGLTVLYAHLLENPPGRRQPEIRNFILILIMAGGAFLLYPEGALAYGLFYLGGSLIWLFFSRPRPAPAKLAWTLLIPVAALLIASLPHWAGTVDFLINSQLQNALKAADHDGFLINTWWGVTTPPSRILTLINLPASWAGFFLFTPPYDRLQGFPLLIWVAGLAVLALGLLLNLAHSLIFQLKDSRGLSLLTKGMIWAALPPVIIGLAYNQLWTIGKIITYLSPLLILLLSQPLWQKPLKNSNLKTKLFTGLVSGSAILAIIAGPLSGLARLSSAKDPDGFGYGSLNYTHPPMRDYKTLYRWEMDTSQLAGCRGVKIEANLLDYIRYMEQKLIYRRLPYDTELSLFFFYFQLGNDFIFRPARFTDCYLGQYWDGQRIRLEFAANNPPPPQPPFEGLDFSDPSLLMKDLHLKNVMVEVRNFRALRQPALSGFYFPNNDGRWTIGPQAVIQVPQGLPQTEFELELGIKSYREPAARNPVKVTVGEQEQSFLLDGAGHYRLSFAPQEKPAYAITIDAPAAPDYIRGWTETYERALGLYLTSLTVKPVPPAKPVPDPAVE